MTKPRGHARPPRVARILPPSAPPPASPRRAAWWSRPALALALAVVTIAVFAPVRHFDFVELDDPLYVRENVHVTPGLTAEGVRWAITTPYAGFWIPAVWVSYMADISVYGPGPSGHHVTNLALHVIAALLLFEWLAAATGAVWRSWFVAALFAVHPLHVESVAWITERKDVLSAVCWMLALWAYSAYVERPGWRRYALVALAFGAGLASKPMVITLPIVLLLVDVWPLRRVPQLLAGWAAWRPLVLEKLPLAAMSAASGVVTVYAHHMQGGIVPLADTSIGHRLANAVVVGAEYVTSTIWPTGLAGVYPLGIEIPAWKIAGAAVLLAATTAGAFAAARRRPFLPVGWLWYLVMLVPVVGLLQVGLQSKADRFTYLPAIGLYIAAVWGIAGIVPRRGWTRAALTVAAFAAVSSYAAAARAQLWHWQDSVAFWTRTWVLEMRLDEYGAHMDLGRTLRTQGRLAEAAEHFTRAVRLRPDRAEPHVDLGVTREAAGRPDLAMAEYEQALRIQPAEPDALNNLGVVLAQAGRNDEAIPRFQAALRARPDFMAAHVNLGLAYVKAGRPAEAIAELEAALKLDPQNAVARDWLARLRAGEEPAR